MLKKSLDNGTKLMIVDDVSPEDAAMLQALYSRSADSVEIHLDKVKQTGSGKFMSSFYVGYGHKSIADCGSTTMFIEGVSLLAAKAIQDWPLYSGQETSTRYIDMSKQRIVDPVGTPESKAILDDWMSFYKENQSRVTETLVTRYPMRDGEKEDMYQRAIKARTFDVLRGFLPAGITTQLSWHTNLRQAGDHLTWLRYHPAHEIGEIACQLGELLTEAYPSSGFNTSMAAVSGVNNKDTNALGQRMHWEAEIGAQYAYSLRGRERDLSSDITVMQANGVKLHVRNGDPGWYSPELGALLPMLKSRPRGCMLPHFLADLGTFTFSFALDFGSFRDLQRHRNGVCRMPLLDTSLGFEEWYLDQLDEELRAVAVQLIEKQTKRIEGISPYPSDRQYYTALGFRVPCQVTYALPALLYVLELRSTKTVHATLRTKMHSCVRLFQKQYPDIALHADLDPDDWDVRRGNQTILERK
jgi:thymidylate synthase ThyX